MRQADAVAPPQAEIEERIVAGTRWVAIRARSSEWSIMTPSEAAEIGSELVRRFGDV